MPWRRDPLRQMTREQEVGAAVLGALAWGAMAIVGLMAIASVWGGGL